MTATLQLPENLTVKAATIDLTGQKFGKLTALRVVGKAKSNSLIWLCVCECGVEIQKTSALLRKSTPTGCGSCVANGRSKAQTARWQREDTWNKGRRYQTIPDNGEFRSRAAWGKALIRKYGNRCQSCGWEKGRCDTHHIIHRSDGGKNTINNGRVLCPNCHRLHHEGTLA